jgi:hypothetical protein
MSTASFPRQIPVCSSSPSLRVPPRRRWRELMLRFSDDGLGAPASAPCTACSDTSADSRPASGLVRKACLYHSDRVAESCCHEIILFRRNVAAANGARQSLPSVFRLNTSVRLVDSGRTVFEESYPELAASSRPSVQLALHLRRIAVALLRHGGVFVP